MHDKLKCADLKEFIGFYVCCDLCHMSEDRVGILLPELWVNHHTFNVCCLGEDAAKERLPKLIGRRRNVV